MVLASLSLPHTHTHFLSLLSPYQTHTHTQHRLNALRYNTYAVVSVHTFVSPSHTHRTKHFNDDSTRKQLKTSSCNIIVEFSCHSNCICRSSEHSTWNRCDGVRVHTCTCELFTRMYSHTITSSHFHNCTE